MTTLFSTGSTAAASRTESVESAGIVTNNAGREILGVRGLQKTYHTGGVSTPAIEELSFSVSEGELACIVGPSGAGKTTLLRCISGLLKPSAGAIFLDDAPISGPPAGMAVVFQEYGRSLFPWYSVRQNIELPLREKRMSKRERNELVAEAIEAVGLSDSANLHPWQLSGGMQQRVAIARAVAYRPRILLMDEPFAAVDAQTRADLEDLVLDLWSRLGVTVLFVTHDIDEAVYLGNRVLVLSGRPTVLMEEVQIDLPSERSQLETRTDPRFGELRNHIYGRIQEAKRGWRP